MYSDNERAFIAKLWNNDYTAAQIAKEVQNVFGSHVTTECMHSRIIQLQKAGLAKKKGKGFKVKANKS